MDLTPPHAGNRHFLGDTHNVLFVVIARVARDPGTVGSGIPILLPSPSDEQQGAFRLIRSDCGAVLYQVVSKGGSSEVKPAYQH